MRILREAIGMRQRGYTVIFAISRGGKLVEKAKKEGFSVFEVSFKKIHWPFSCFFLASLVRREKIELIHTHSSLDAWLGGIVGRLTRRLVVRTRHLSGRIRGGLNSRLLYGKLADFVTTTCAEIVPAISASSKKPLSKCRSIPTGIDPTQIRFSQEEKEAFRRQLKVGPDDLLIGTACFMRSWKGISDFLAAAKKGKEDPRKKWVVIGGGHEATYREMARSMELENTVFFTGHLTHPFAAMAALDIFVLLSTANEGVSQAILQAAFLEKPLVATPTGGLKEVCLDRVTGLLVPPHCPDQVFEKITELSGDKSLRDSLGKKGRELVLGSFSWKNTLDATEEVYRNVASSYNPRL